MGTGKINAGSSPAMDQHPIHGRTEILLVACGVREQRITARKMERVKEEGREGKEGRKPLPPPSFFFFGSRPIFRADKTPKIPFLGLSLLPNPTETLATQAILLVASCCRNRDKLGPDGPLGSYVDFTKASNKSYLPNVARKFFAVITQCKNSSILCLGILSPMITLLRT